MTKPTFYTAFSNTLTNSIPNLSEEAMKISDLLQELAFSDKLYYIKDEIFSLDRLMLNFGKYGRRIDIFYFSGHGKNGCLQLVENMLAEPNEMSDVINSSLKNAKLIFFNACETFKLAQTIVEKRKSSDGKIVLISCKGEISSFIAERFATLLFTQIGQPGKYRDAYDQAKGLAKIIHKNLRFKEFDSKKAVLDVNDEFDIGYIEIGQDDPGASKSSYPAAAANPVQPSIIGNDKLTRDALTTNYMHEVVESLVTNAGEIDNEKIKLLKDALLTAGQIAKGEKKNKQATQLFNQAAEALPGLSSGSAFDSLINAEKNLNKPYVKNLIQSRDSGTTISSMLKRVNSIEL